MLDLKAIRDLYRRDLPRPIDVPNFLWLRNEQSYARYALTVAPAILLTGGSVHWAGKHLEAVCGEPRAESLLVVRYPNHRAFLRMVLNPYYLAINVFRVRGVARFEAGFTHPADRYEALPRERDVLVAHFDEPLEDLRNALGGPHLVYHTERVAEIALLKNPAPHDPNPLAHRALAMFRWRDALRDVAARAELAPTTVLQRYRSVPIRAYLRPRSFRG